MENLNERLVALPQFVTGYRLLKNKKGGTAYVQVELSTFSVSEQSCEGAGKLSYSTSSTDTHMLVDGLPAMRGVVALRDRRNRPVTRTSSVFSDFLADHGLKLSDFAEEPNPLGVFKLTTNPPVALFHRLTDEKVLNSKTGQPYPRFFRARARAKKFVPKDPWSDYSVADLLELANFNGVKVGRTKSRDKLIAKLEAAGVYPEG